MVAPPDLKSESLVVMSLGGTTNNKLDFADQLLAVRATVVDNDVCRKALADVCDQDFFNRACLTLVSGQYIVETDFGAPVFLEKNGLFVGVTEFARKPVDDPTKGKTCLLSIITADMKSTIRAYMPIFHRIDPE